MTRLFLYVGLSIMLFSCNKEKLPKETPQCIEDKINAIADGEVWDPSAKIYSYTYNGKTVYYFPPRCCDIPSTLYDENCNVICSPDGGINGAGDGQCTDFFTTRTNEKLIWEDNR